MLRSKVALEYTHILFLASDNIGICIELIHNHTEGELLVYLFTLIAIHQHLELLTDFANFALIVQIYRCELLCLLRC